MKIAVITYNETIVVTEIDPVGETVRLRVESGWGVNGDGPAGWVSEQARHGRLLFKLVGIEPEPEPEPLPRSARAEEGEPEAISTCA